MNWLRRMMYGRYGNDSLGNFCFIVYLLLFVLQLVFRRTPAGMVIYKRQLENQKFLQIWNSVKQYFRFYKMRWQERKGTKALFRCPKCHQIIRVPKGRGKIAITCPKCRFEFIKKT